MSLTPGQRLGAYEILSKLGEGGMGEVYRARDSQLDRDVALKILPPAFAADPERVARFEREAKTLAVLNHPNIASIYGLERSASTVRDPHGRPEDTRGATGAGQAFATPALVMELVPGRTLDDIIALDGPLAPEAVVHIAAQIADGLEAAHEAGIVHRDLKPANIKLKGAWGPTPTRGPDGRLEPTFSASDVADWTVKLLDFGLARAMDSSGAIAGAAADTMSSPTMLSPEHRRGAATEQGMILGTAGYMSPEQARGRAVDKRADIWAFGVVVYEMLTGKRLFGGETATEIIAAVIKDAPDLRALPATTPPALRQLIARCLERDPKLRLRDIGEARILLQRANDLTAVGSLTPSAQKLTSRGVLLATAGALVLAAISAAIVWNARPESTVPVRRFELPTDATGSDTIAIAPDGSRIAYLAGGHLFTRALDTGETRDLGSVSAGAQGLFFSPDGRRIAYGSESMLRIVPVDGGSEFELTKVPGSGRVLDGTWLENGTIVFLVWREGAYKVPATGGTVERVSAIDTAKEIDFHSVTALPDGQLIVTTHLRGEDTVRAEIVGRGGTRTPIADDLNIDRVRFRGPNHLLFARVRDNVGVWTAPFADGRIDLAKAVALQPGAATFDASVEGTLLCRIPSKERYNLVWVEFDKRATGEGAGRYTRSVSSVAGSGFEAAWSVLAVSPDGRRAAVAMRTPGGQDDLFVRDLATGVDTRVRLPPEARTRTATGLVVRWSHAGRLLVGTGSIETSQIFDVPADGSAGGRPLVGGTLAVTSLDGRELIFNREEQAQFRLYRAPIQSDGSVGKAEPLFAAADAPNANAFDLSPDGRLLAFTDREQRTGQINVFVAAYPDLRERRQVTAGGSLPRFSRDSRQLYFIGGARTIGPARSVTIGELRAVAVTHSPLSVGPARVLMNDQPGSQTTLTGFDLGRDGRVLMTNRVPSTAGDEGRLVLLQNWPMAAKK